MGTEKNGDNPEMKILYVGHYKEGTGWARATINNMLALNSLPDVDIVARNVRLSKETEIPTEISEMESKDLQNIDVCIQHVLPHHLIATQKFKKNIAFFEGETDTIKFCGNWHQLLMCMDEIWVPCANNKNTLTNDGIKNVKIIPHAADLSLLKKMDGLNSRGLVQDNFKFYFIGEVNDRKNIKTIIRCFHSEFSPSEPVDLLLKVSHPSGPAAAHHFANKMSEEVKNSLRIYSRPEVYKKEQIVAEYLSDEDLRNLHNVCDCYLATSHGEAWNIPAFEAMAFGNTPICSKEGGALEYIDEDNINTGTLINGVSKICNHNNAAFNNIATGRETWFEPDDKEIMKSMRYYYENKDKINREEGWDQACKFDYDNVSKMMWKAINE